MNTNQGFPLKKLKELLQKAKEADGRLKQFGAERHRYRWNPPASPADVEAFEQEIGTTLPEEYRKFLLLAGDGGAGPYYGLFPLEKVRQWLTWEVRPDKEPRLYPGMPVFDWEEAEESGTEDREGIEDELDRAPDECFWGSIPIGSQGDSYFMLLMVTGPHRGRVVYVESELSYIFFPREEGFLAWYVRWLREIAAGYRIFWYGTNLDGDEEELRRLYESSADEEEKRLVLSSMKKFPSLSKEAGEWLVREAQNYMLEPDARWLLDQLYGADPRQKDAFMERRWAAGMYEGVVYEVYYSIHSLGEEEGEVLGRWWKRILEKMPRISQTCWYTALRLLTRCPQVKLQDVAGLWEIAEPKSRRELVRAFGSFPDAEEHLELFLKMLEEREDFELLNAILLGVPIVESEALFLAVKRACEYAEDYAESVSKPEGEDDESWNLLERIHNAYRVCYTGDIILNRLRDKFINPKLPGIPRPRRLNLQVQDREKLDVKIGNKHGPEETAIHPLIAMVIEENFNGMPASAEDWEQIFFNIETLRLQIEPRHIRVDGEWIYMEPPKPRTTLPYPYYYDLHDWSVIGRMKNLRELSIRGICVDDFSFLAQCKNVTTLSLYHTNFSDCRLLCEMSNLREADLRMCPLEHEEALAGKGLEYQK